MKRKIKIKFFEGLLGTASSDPAIHETYIASLAPDAASTAQEVEALGTDEVIERSKTMFARLDGVPTLWDYQIKGFFKDAARMLNRARGSKTSKLPAFLKIIDGLVFVYPRQIPLALPHDGKLQSCQRPLRAQTAQGERVSIAHSEQAPIGTEIEFEIEAYELKGKDTKKEESLIQQCIEEWLDYGKCRGLGQWRNSGKGRFTWEYSD